MIRPRLATLVIFLGTGCRSDDPPGDEANAATTGSGGTASTSMTSTSSSTGHADTGTASSDGELDGSNGPGKDDVPNPIACDVWTGEPCDPGEKCMPWDAKETGGFTGTRCTPIASDPVGPGEPCTVEESPYSGLDDCGAFSMCWGVNPRTLEGHCTAFCQGTELIPTCDNPCEVCSLTSSTDVFIPCLLQCDPLMQDCPDGFGCYGLGSGPVCVPYFGDVDGGLLGDPCSHATTCQPGFQCASSALLEGCRSASCCTSFCDVSDAASCPGTRPETECAPLFEDGEAPVDRCVDDTNVGFCILPD